MSLFGLRYGAGVGTLNRVLGAGVGVLLVAALLPAQTDTGRILGSITDESGAVVPNATVTITDADRGTTRALTTNGAGEYLAPNLLSGQYTVRVSSPGFKNVERRNIGLEVAKDIRVDFSLQVGDTQSTVTVSAEVPLVDSTSAVLGGTLTNQMINDLPLNGRNFMGLLQLRPGVMAFPGGGKWSQSSNGLRPEYNVYILNGIDAIEGFSAQSALNAAGISGDSASLLPVDAIQEFNVQQNPKAEYGWKPGVIANIGLKSGTNSLHGSAYAFGRHSALDATNPFIPAGVPKQETALEQFGGTAGGPVKHDKFFYFLAYEGQREVIGAPSTVLLPTTASLGGNVTNSLLDACNSIAADKRSALSLAMAGMDTGCGIVSAKQNLFQSGSSISFVPVIPMQMHSDNGLAKLDYNINSRHSLNGEIFLNSFGGLATQNQVHDYWRTYTENQSRLGGIHYVWIATANLANEAKFGMNRVYQFSTSGDCDAIGQPDYSYLHTGAQSCGFPNVAIQGFSSLGCCANFPKIQGPDYTAEFIDDASWTRGKHAFKFGGEIRRMVYNGGTYRAGKGSFTFRASGATTALQTFIQGAPFRGVNFVGNPNVSVSDWGYAGFFQDDWRIARGFTLNLGLRYEYVTPIREANNGFANFDPNQGMVQMGKQASTPYQPDRNNFAPRLGFAWDLTGSGRTILRGGGALIYVLQGFNVLTSQQGSTAVTTGLNTSPTGALLNGVPGPGNMTAGAVTLTGAQLNWSLAGPIFPAGKITCTTAAPCPILAVDPNLRVPYVTSWNLGLQRQLTQSLALDMSYVGNHGSKLTEMVDINAAALGSGWTGNPAAASTTSENQSRPYFSKFPYLSNINQIRNVDRSNYNGLQATLTQRFTRGLNYTVGYTFSHSLDMSPGDWRNANVPMYSPNPKLDYGNSNYDLRHRFTATVTYALPDKKSFGQMLEGWQLNSILNVQSALPWAVMDTSTDVSGTGEFTDRWNFFGNPSDFSHRGSAAIPFFAGTSNASCLTQASAMGPAGVSSLQKWGCYVAGGSMLLPPPLGTLGTLGNNVFRGNGLHLLDLSVTKKWRITERVSAQFRVESFNILNVTAYSNPAYNQGPTGQHNNPTSTGGFGNSTTTPDVQIANPQVGGGAARSTQLGLKLIF
ncbi:MAG TPA: carboxypeptidase regulatory-like domain-containing protein [Bryobacteraceae bacterium]|nr:carboxypeptidase regulatory-like domain-containing protein [Bryobacteraceae bacterium]